MAMHRMLAWGIGAAVIAIAAPGDAGDRSEPAGTKPYRVVEGAVYPATYNGYRRYHATCSHCHGPAGLGSSFGPSLIDRPLAFGAFAEVVRLGSARGTAVMQGFADDPNVEPHIDDIYAYLMARTDGVLGRGRPRRIK
jgi:mono/diheme cytochrome c family protein